MNPLHWIGPEATTALSLTLLHSLWQVSLAVGMLWCVERIWRKLPVERNYTLHAGMLLLTIALLPLTFFAVQPTRELAVVPSVNFDTRTEFTPPPEVVVATELDLPPAVQRPSEPSPQVMPTVALPSETTASPPASYWWPIAAMWVAVCYVLGVLVMLLRLMLGIRRTERIRRRATHIEPGPLASTFARLARELGVSLRCVLATSRDVLVPTVVGVVKPTILLPASALTGLSANELEMILLHELAHVRRHDQWVNLVQRLAEVVLFFNPVLWYLSRRIATLREYCCDELTCRQLSPGDTTAHVEYAATLLHVVELARPASAVPAELTALAATGRGPSELRRRVARLFGEPLAEPMRLSRPQGILLLAMALVLIGAPFAQSSSENESGTDEQKSEAEVVDVDETESAAPSSGPTLRGRITDTVGKPIPGVRVVLYGGIGTRRRGQEATSDTDGRYEFVPLTTGAKFTPDEGPHTHYVGVQLEHSEFVSADGRSWRDIYVPSEHGHVEQLDLQVSRGGKVRGAVVDAATGKPVPDLDLRIYRLEGDNEGDYFLTYAKTNAEGEFESLPMFPGTYIIDINDRDFEGRRSYPKIGRVVVEGEKFTDVALTTADLPILQDPFQIEGSAIGENGKSMVYGSVGLRLTGNKLAMRSTGGGIDGRNLFGLRCGPIERTEPTAESPFGVGTHPVELFGHNTRNGYKLVSRTPSEPLFITDNPNQIQLENGNRYIRPNEPVKFKLVFAKVDEGSDKSRSSSTNNTGGGLGEKSDDVTPPPALDQARIAALQELVDSYTQVHDRIEMLFKHGIRRNESLQQARLALEVAKGDLAYAKGDVRQAVEYYELAVAAADEGVQAIALAEDKSLVTLDVLLDAHRRRAEVKTTLNRLKEELAKDKSDDTTSSSATSADTVPIQCLDANEKPVAGAEVYVFQHEGGDKGKYRQFGPFTTDADGRATCGEAISYSDEGHFDRWFYARVPGKLVGVARSSQWNGSAPYNSEGRIELVPSRSISGRVTVPDGYAPTSVTVAVNSFATGSGLGRNSFPRYGAFAGIDTALPSLFECQPASDGTFQLHDLPQEGRVCLRGTADGLGEAQWHTNDTHFKGIQLNFSKEGRLEGVVSNYLGEPMANVEVAAQIQASVGQRVGYLTTFRTTTDDQGHYELRGLPEWDLAISLTDPENNLVFHPTSLFFIAPGREMTRNLTMEEPVEIRGRVVDTDGNPVEKAAVSAIMADTHHELHTGAVCDSNGSFVLQVPTGKFKIYISGLPKGFKYPELKLLKVLEIAPGQRPIEGLEVVAQREVEKEAVKDQATDQGSDLLRDLQSDSQPLLDVMAQVHGYKPAEGKVLARVAPPFDVIRLEYFRAANSSRAGEIDEGPTAMTFRWDGEILSEWGSSFGDRDEPGYTITGLLDVLMEQKPQSISGPKSLLDKPLAGDWVMRTGADRQQVIAELEEILRNQFDMKVRLRIRNLERDVYVATGRYQFKPIDDSSPESNKDAGNGSLNRIQVFANKLSPEAGAGGGSGEVDRFLLMVGHWIGTPIVSELGPPSQRHISWRFHDTVGTTPGVRRENHEAEIVLANITRQTGIEFKKDRRLIEVLFVEQDKEDVE